MTDPDAGPGPSPNPNAPRLLVTGATGLLGNNVVRLALARGWRVRALVRSPQKAIRILGEPSGLERAVGDLEDVRALTHALDGVDAMVHAAAYFRESYKGGDHRRTLERINVDATLELIDRARRRGVRRIVHVSSVAAIVPRPDGRPSTEDDLRKPGDAPDDYYRSKILADLAVADYARAHPETAIRLILPGWMFGPGDAGPTSAGQIVLDFLRQQLPGTFESRWSLVDARDVALAILNALDRTEDGVPNGRRYLVAGRPLSLDDLARTLQDVSGIPAPKLRVPWALALMLAAVQEGYARLTGKPVLLSWDAARTLYRERRGNLYDNARAADELGVTFRPVHQTINDTIAWYLDNGYLDGVTLPNDVRAATDAPAPGEATPVEPNRA